VSKKIHFLAGKTGLGTEGKDSWLTLEKISNHFDAFKVSSPGAFTFSCLEACVYADKKNENGV
jgi:hypothetical protein